MNILTKITIFIVTIWIILFSSFVEGAQYFTKKNIHSQSQDVIKVFLLGTGYPTPQIRQFGPSILVEAGEENFLFDCGRGAAIRLSQLKIPSVIDHHTTPEQAGIIFSQVKPKLAIYSHVSNDPESAQELISYTQKKYSGRVVVG